jgi:two-component system, NtrC family, response regulator AtoC
LRERKEDLNALVKYFLRAHSQRYGTQVNAPSPYILRLMQRHGWPGNIRELSNLVERYSILGTEESITNEMVGAISKEPTSTANSSNGPMAPLKSMTRRSVQEMERKIILRALVAHRWNRKRAAKELKISYRALLYKIRDAGLPSRRPSPGPQTGEIMNGRAGISPES